MIVYTMPGFLSKKKINIIFLTYVREHSEQLKYEDRISFVITGTPNNCSWKGTPYDWFIENGIYEQIKKLYELYTVDLSCVVRWDFSNLLLEKDFYYDTVADNLLSLSNNGSTQLLISGPNMHKYFRENFPNYIYLYYSDLTINENLIIDKNTFLIRNNYNIKETNGFSKDNTEIILHLPCSQYCNLSQWGQCSMQNQMNIYNFSKFSPFNSCSYMNVDIHKTDNLMQDYYNNGYRSFQPFEWTYDYKMLINYVNDLIKPEYQQEALQYLLISLESEK